MAMGTTLRGGFSFLGATFPRCLPRRRIRDHRPKSALSDGKKTFGIDDRAARQHPGARAEGLALAGGV